ESHQSLCRSQSGAPDACGPGASHSPRRRPRCPGHRTDLDQRDRARPGVGPSARRAAARVGPRRQPSGRDAARAVGGPHGGGGRARFPRRPCPLALAARPGPDGRAGDAGPGCGPGDGGGGRRGGDPGGGAAHDSRRPHARGGPVGPALPAGRVQASRGPERVLRSSRPGRRTGDLESRGDLSQAGHRAGGIRRRVKGLILAAGEGTRLRPLTSDRPKPMVAVAGVPMIAYALDWMRLNGVSEVAINTHYRPEPLVAFVGDGAAFGLSVRDSPEPVLLGSSGALAPLQSFFRGEDLFVVLYGDVLTNQPLEPVIDAHRRAKADVALVLTEVDDPRRAGMVELDPLDRILSLVEKPRDWRGAGRWANAGVYLL